MDWSIQDIARLSGTTRRTLRHYGDIGLPAIAEVLTGQARDTDALVIHLHWLQKEKDPLDRQIGAVENTITKLRGGERLMAEEMFDGFDHTEHKDEEKFEWLTGIPGTPGTAAGPSREYFVGLGEMYVADPRFSANYGGQAGAEFVREAMTFYATNKL